MSSPFQLGIVAKSANEVDRLCLLSSIIPLVQLTLFSLADVQNLHSDSSNINKEVNDLPNRSFQIDPNVCVEMQIQAEKVTISGDNLCSVSEL